MKVVLEVQLNKKLIILLPLILNYFTAFFCSPTSDSGKTVKFRPNSIYFALIWPILYILLGLAWYHSHSVSLLYIILTLLLCLWLIVYSCIKNKQISIYILFLILMSILFCYTNSTIISKNLLIPLMIWCLFATLLSLFEFN